MRKLISLVLVLCMVLGMSVSAFATDGTEVIVSTADDLQKALDEAAGNTTITLSANIDGNVTVTQKPDVQITIKGNDNTFDGGILINAKSARYETAALTVENVCFNTNSLNEENIDACIRLGASGDNSTRYANNITVSDCTFTGIDNKIVAVKSYTGGDWNVTIKDCEVDSGMHSLAQLKNVEKNLVINGCDVKSKNGVNVNNSPSATISDCTFDVQGYAVRFGADNNTGVESFIIKNCDLKSACAETDDAVIEFRKGAVNAELTMNGCKFDGTTHIKGATDETIITVDENQTVIKNEDGSMTIKTEHTHSWSTEWSKDDTHHWYVCTAEGCDITDATLMNGYAEHTFIDGKCECGVAEPVVEPEHVHSWTKYPNAKNETEHWFECTAEDCDEIKDKAEHTKETEGQWTVDGKPTCTEDGFMTWCCTDCGYIMEAKTVEGSALGHTYVDGTCEICGEADSSEEGPTGDVPTVKHEHSWSTAWAKNETHHWNVCTAEGCDITDATLMNGYAVHTYTNGVCVCGVAEPVVEPDYSDDDWFYEEEEDNHTSSSDMSEIIDEVGKNDTSVTIEDVNKNTTISEKAMEKAVEEGLDVEFKGSGYTLTLKNENADFSNFKGNFNPHIDTDASCNAVMKNELKENGIDSSDVQVIKTEFSGELPGEMELEFNLDKELRGKKVYFYYWNPELKQYELIPHTINGNKVKVSLSHFSTYIVTDEPIAGAVVHKGATVVGSVSGDKVNPSTGANDFVGAAVAMAVVSSMGIVALSKHR